jgi:hypothetical protein
MSLRARIRRVWRYVMGRCLFCGDPLNPIWLRQGHHVCRSCASVGLWMPGLEEDR